ncbi:MAG: PQQ-dependent sugar dehydrogenase [Actinomycetota bacterium]|nr:PQQ-dependent sugar dehydrogenase [Actinomycetota bacterium]
MTSLNTPSRWLIATALIFTSCGPIATPIIGPGTTAPPPTVTTAPINPSTAPLQGLALTRLTTGLEWPVAATVAPSDGRLFVVEKEGFVRIVDGPTAHPTPFLDITDKVGDEHAEQGLVGLVFHPQYESNGRAFVYYTREDWSTALVEYTAGEDGDHLDPDSARILFTLDQPHPAHNGADLAFGPDGYLYVSLGDGGVTFEANAQQPHDIRGTILRLDVDSSAPYAIPPDNPFADGDAGAPEVWVYGLRNPWRFAIDQQTDQVFISDVGFERWEEVNVIDLAADGGSNFGWAVVEGPECFEAETCDRTDLIPPVLSVEHVRTCALIGGPVYRGAAIPELNGHYFYGDFCVGWVRSFLFVDGKITEETTWSDDFGEPGQITSFATDSNGEILILLQNGEIHRIDPVR